MSHVSFHAPPLPDNPHTEELIVVRELRGTGRDEHNPLRRIVCVYRKDGEKVAEERDRYPSRLKSNAPRAFGIRHIGGSWNYRD